jgi:hypothetical protein
VSVEQYDCGDAYKGVCCCGRLRCRGYYYVAFLHLSGPDGNEPDLNYLPCSTEREAATSVLDDLFLDGYRRVTVSDWIGTLTTHSLRSSPRRKRLFAEHIARQQALKREQRSKNIRYGRVRAVVERVIDSPTPADIRFFFRRWQEVTGYGARDESLRETLAPAKKALIQMLVKMAIENGWTHGHRIDWTVHNPYKNVIYIDTPLGQISFHVRYDKYRDLPPYEKEWSGIHNTPELVTALFAA